MNSHEAVPRSLSTICRRSGKVGPPIPADQPYRQKFQHNAKKKKKKKKKQRTNEKNLCVCQFAFFNGQELGVDVEQTNAADYTQDALGVNRWVYSVFEGILIVNI